VVQQGQLVGGEWLSALFRLIINAARCVSDTLASVNSPAPGSPAKARYGFTWSTTDCLKAVDVVP